MNHEICVKKAWEMWWKDKEEHENLLKDAITKGEYELAKKLLSKDIKPSVN
jgi:hypothetical protein